MNPKLTGTNSYWCGSCGSYQAGDIKETKVLDSDYEEDTPYEDIGWYECRVGLACNHQEPLDDPGQVFPEELIGTVCWYCSNCNQRWGIDHKTARLCCSGQEIKWEYKTSKNGRYSVLGLVLKDEKKEKQKT